MSLWSYYKSLAPRTRLYIGGGIIIYSLLGIAVSNKLEKKLDLVPTEEDKAKLDALVPHIRAVERDDPTSPKSV
ncbi:hypothetical protein EX30DRAFT_370637 [Ascodesmis nigricans]|uniref:Uncharacterized protein n=1 Tax=Ascodesmis nigricans TaxID=341454 RepID=A0A4S2N0V5_9PEZI|nr:hypothetical protein EX30DRAFT_370637 [Ascodesmis nigricans]